MQGFTYKNAAGASSSLLTREEIFALAANQHLARSGDKLLPNQIRFNVSDLRLFCLRGAEEEQLRKIQDLTGAPYKVINDSLAGDDDFFVHVDKAFFDGLYADARTHTPPASAAPPPNLAAIFDTSQRKAGKPKSV